MTKKETKKRPEKRRAPTKSREEYDKFAEEHGFKLKKPDAAKKGALNSTTLPPDIRKVLEELGLEFGEDGGSFILPIWSPDPDESNDPEPKDDTD